MYHLPRYISFYYRSLLKKYPGVKNQSAQAAYEALCAAMIEWGDQTDRPAPFNTALEALNSPAEQVRETAAGAVQLIASKSDNPSEVYQQTLDRANARGRLYIAIFLGSIVSTLSEEDAIGFMRRLILDRSSIVREKATSLCIYTPHAKAMLPTLYEALKVDRDADNPYRSTRHCIGLVEHGYYFSQDPLDPDRMSVHVLYKTGTGDQIEYQGHDIHKRDLKVLGEIRVVEELREWCLSNGRHHFEWMLG